jgi:CubicO group peptidase (beta-lactamase class C family)
MKKLLFASLILVLLICACSTATPAATRTAAEIPLVLFTDQHFAIQMVRPEGWVELQPGTLVRDDSPPYYPQLFYGAFPGMSVDWADAYFAPELGLERLPDREATYESEVLSWELTTFDIDHPEAGPIVVDGALSETDSTLYVVAVLAPQDDHESLHEAVFLPALQAFTPLALDERDRLTATELMADEYQGEGLVHNDYLLPVGESAAALHRLEGMLTVPEFEMEFDAHAGGVSASEEYFPGFSVEFLTYEEYLVPANREIVPSTGEESYWSIVLSPGKVWSEPQDGGMSRASFPFILVSDQLNQAHNGVATFLYDNDEVSSLYLQVTQETAAWKRVDFWGQTPMEYSPATTAGRGDLRAQFAEELSLQTPIRPWSELENDYDPHLLSTFNDRFDPRDISATGLIMDDTIYLQPCQTRYGPFPHCAQMRHGVFSVTKSMGAAIAMLRLAEKYGQEVFDLKIADYVEVTAEHDGWDEVTFRDALNMATGIGDNPNLQPITAEEDQPRFNQFLEARSAQDKLDVCFSYGNYPWGPGEVARYNSINTFVLSVAMDSLLKGKEGPEADIWDMVLEEVYKPIGIFHAPMMRTHEPDRSRGIPIFGFGLYPTVDDVAKVTRLLLHAGQHEGQQLLHAGKLAEALYQTDVTGLPTGDSNEYGEATYNMSFWSSPFRTDGGGFFLIPYMSGFGGNHVALMPNGIVAFRFTDAHIYGVESMVKVAEGIRPF